MRIDVAALVGSVVLASAPAHAVFRAVVRQVDVDLEGGSVGVGSATCTDSWRVGGGIDTLDEGTLVAELSQLAGDGSVFGWTGFMRNDAATGGGFAVAAICTDEGSGADPVQLSTTLLAGSVGQIQADCAPPQVALGGGVSANTALGASSLVTMAPVFGFAPLASRLYQRSDGTSPAPDGFGGFVRNDDSVANVITAKALCAHWPNAVTEVDSASVASGAVASLTVLCPDGKTAVGGGADAANAIDLELVASGPVLPGAPVQRIVSLPNGPTADGPIGWRVALRNGSPSTRAFKAAAVCVPEPGAFACAAAALAALARAAARRG